MLPVNETTGKVGYCKPEETELKEAVQSRLAFGDTPSHIIATIRRKKCAEENSSDPKIINILTENSFVDDIFGYCRYDEDINEVKEKLREVAAKGAFKIKEVFISGQHPENIKDKLVGNEETKALGYK